MKKTIALVVSYNRLPQLKQCIKALRQQTIQPDAILVVNNGSSDYTSVWLDKQPDIIHHYQDNSGTAGGYHAGLLWAMQNGYDWVWCMDDDGLPSVNAFENLMHHADDGKSLLSCVVIDEEDKSSLVWPSKSYKTLADCQHQILTGEAHPFNGTLLHRRTIEKVGYPLTHLFYWGVEREYLYRIMHQFDIPVKTIGDSVLYHPSFHYCHKQEWDYATSWKMYFYIRNRYRVLQSKYNNRLTVLYLYMYFIAAFCWSVFIYQKQNLIKKILFVFWPMRDAFLSRYHATPAIVQQSLHKKNKQSVFTVILHPFRKLILEFFIPVPMPDAPTSR
ncbi:MAG: glycosyltransferase [Ferruginibacter sp.]